MTILALPSKGRLHERSVELLQRSGLRIDAANTRGYHAEVEALPGLRIRFLSSAEIPTELVNGNVHFGIVGEDLLREKIVDADRSILSIDKLGFGRADLVIAVPEAWIDVDTLFDLDEVAAEIKHNHRRRLRIATKYTHLCQTFLFDNDITEFRIVESVGATEGAPASGLADCIADITTTGSTLAANRLKVLDDGVILRSEANLFVSLTTGWTDDDKRIADLLLRRIASSRRAEAFGIVHGRYKGPTKAIVDVPRTWNARWLTKPRANQWSDIVLECEKHSLLELTDALSERGVEDIVVLDAKHIVLKENKLSKTFADNLALLGSVKKPSERPVLSWSFQ